MVKGRRQSVEPGEGEGKDDYYSYSVSDAKLNLEPNNKPTGTGNRVFERPYQVDSTKDMDNVFKNHHATLQRKASDSESDFDGDNQKYSLEHLDSKIQEMKQTFTSSPSNRNSFLQQITNPQDVVQSHYLQVQSMIQDTKLKSAQTKKIEDKNKEDYFLASSASDTSLNDSLKSGNLDEHEIIYQTDRSSNSLRDEDLNISDKLSKTTMQTNARYNAAFPSSQPSGFSPYVPQAQAVTSPKHTSPFPHVKPPLPSLQPSQGLQWSNLYSPQHPAPPPQYHQLMSPISGAVKHSYSPRLVS